MTTTTLYIGDCREILRTMPSNSVQCCVTSPPYWKLRDYGCAGQIGREQTPEEYVACLVEVFRQVQRVLREDGTLWCNLGDSYCGAPGGSQGKNGQRVSRTFTTKIDLKKTGAGLKAKDLVGIPWRVAFALQTDGWWLRSDIIWHKPNPMPEAVKDRPTRAHEYMFQLSQSTNYYYNAAAVAEAVTGTSHRRGRGVNLKAEGSVWTIAPEPFKGAHFATFPTKLVEPCILAGSRPGDTILDPFNGAGTTGVVAARLKRHYAGIDISAQYVEMSRVRIAAAQPEVVTRDPCEHLPQQR